jgi:hypothetical protein
VQFLLCLLPAHAISVFGLLLDSEDGGHMLTSIGLHGVMSQKIELFLEPKPI